jgi:hypothetical protein
MARLRAICLALPEATEKNVDWDEVADVCEDAYRGVASPRLASKLDHPTA